MGTSDNMNRRKATLSFFSLVLGCACSNSNRSGLGMLQQRISALEQRTGQMEGLEKAIQELQQLTGLKGKISIVGSEMVALKQPATATQKACDVEVSLGMSSVQRPSENRADLLDRFRKLEQGLEGCVSLHNASSKEVKELKDRVTLICEELRNNEFNNEQLKLINDKCQKLNIEKIDKKEVKALVDPVVTVICENLRNKVDLRQFNVLSEQFGLIEKKFNKLDTEKVGLNEFNELKDALSASVVRQEKQAYGDMYSYRKLHGKIKNLEQELKECQSNSLLEGRFNKLKEGFDRFEEEFKKMGNDVKWCQQEMMSRGHNHMGQGTEVGSKIEKLETISEDRGKELVDYCERLKTQEKWKKEMEEWTKTQDTWKDTQEEWNERLTSCCERYNDFSNTCDKVFNEIKEKITQMVDKKLLEFKGELDKELDKKYNLKRGYLLEIEKKVDEKIKELQELSRVLQEQNIRLDEEADRLNGMLVTCRKLDGALRIELNKLKENNEEFVCMKDVLVRVGEIENRYAFMLNELNDIKKEGKKRIATVYES